MPRLCSSLLLSLLIASSASAVTIDWTPIGNPGNACEPQPANSTSAAGCFGAVNYSYNIGTYEVTNAQYAEFLNTKAASDPLALYHTSMQTDPNNGGITRGGISGSFTYAVKTGYADRPVIYVSFYDALRFVNWLNNGQGSSDTETGSYTLLGGTATPSNGETVPRNVGVSIFLPSDDEWYKAAYYNAPSASYFDYPAGSDTPTTCATPTATANRSNCGGVSLVVTNRGSYTGSASPYGTFDQGGNVWEWNERIAFVGNRGLRGGSFDYSRANLAASAGGSTGPSEGSSIGFRMAGVIPEPSTGLLVITGLLSLAGWRRACA